MLSILLLIATVWLAVMALFVAVCRMAARGDARAEPDVARPTRRIDRGVVVWEEEPPSARPHDTRSHGARRRLTARGVRTHGVR